VYVLKGKTTTLLWLRDKESNWQNELEKGASPRILSKMNFDFNAFDISPVSKVSIYDPWSNEWTTANNNSGAITLPDFRRSLVIRVN
jgi:hypothetical protein